MLFYFLFRWVCFTSFFDHYLERNIYAFIYLEHILWDLLQNWCSIKPIKIYLCKRYVLIKVVGYKPLNKLSSLVFFKDFDHTISFILWKTAISKNIYFYKLPPPPPPSSMAPFVHSWNSNYYYICFFLLKLLNTIAKSCQINWRIERTKICGSIYFCKNKILSR